MLVDMKMLQIHRRDGTNYCFLLDAEDWDAVNQFAWRVVIPDLRWPHYYAARHVGKHSQYLHRFLAGPGFPYVDHINGNTLDNRRCNLRLSSASENAKNVRHSCRVPNFVNPDGEVFWGRAVNVKNTPQNRSPAKIERRIEFAHTFTGLE